jgi:multicomponent Na+:H+ antiporter subunit E
MTAEPSTGERQGSWSVLARSAVLRFVALAVVWWAMTEGDGGLWAYGVVVGALATAVNLRLWPPRPSGGRVLPRLAAAVRLAGWFVRRSFAGGVDVARRATGRRLDLEPGLVEHRLSLPPGNARLVVVDMVSLMPGTLSCELDGDVLRVHALDVSSDVHDQLAELEERVARVASRSPA